MNNSQLLVRKISPDWEGMLDCIMRKGKPSRVHFIELFLDPEVQTAVCQMFGLLDDLDPADPYFEQRRQIAIQRFLGYDYVRCSVEEVVMPFNYLQTQDTAQMVRDGGRAYINEHSGPVTNWDEFESYPWPDPADMSTRSLEWYQKNLPDDMCIVAHGDFAHFLEWICWLMGYESLCIALYDQRDLVEAISKRIMSISEAVVEILLQFDRVKIIWGSDDMGFRSGTMISPSDLREFVLPGHKRMAQMAHAAGRPYMLHSCGKLTEVMDDLIDDVQIDAKHSFEDTIESVTTAKEHYGDRLALLGGIDIDFLCRADESQIRKRVRETLAICMPGGGFCLGTGNSVANYIPLENYLIMLDEGRKFSS